MDLEAGATKMDGLQRDDLSFPQSLPEFQRLFPNEKSIPKLLKINVNQKTSIQIWKKNRLRRYNVKNQGVK